MTNQQLVGKRAKAVYDITHKSGSARLRDSDGNLQEVSCRIESSEEIIPAGSYVILLHYDKENQVFEVKPDMLGDLDIPKFGTV